MVVRYASKFSTPVPTVCYILLFIIFFVFTALNLYSSVCSPCFLHKTSGDFALTSTSGQQKEVTLSSQDLRVTLFLTFCNNNLRA